jgi:two-component system, OmpR family, sensor histidine kinase CreC
VNAFVVVTALADALLLAFTVWCLGRARRRGASLRLRIFAAMACSTLVGALVTGLYAVAVDPTIGVQARAARVLPKAFVLAVTLLPLAAAGAAIVGKRIARSIEELTEAAARIAEGERAARVPFGRSGEAQRLGRALASIRRELEGKPYAAAFLRDAWHDLKTPVAALKATLEVLDDAALRDPAAARRFVANLRRSTDQLERRLADLVTLARYETAQTRRRGPASVGALVSRAMAQVAPLAAARRVSVSRAGARHERVRCDEEALARALGNLLENAVDATPGGRVGVAVARDPKEGVVIDVVNEPARVPDAVRGRLFERAVTSDRKSGSGLGLAIARAAVEAHGGRVRFVEMGPPRVRVRIELPRGG